MSADITTDIAAYIRRYVVMPDPELTIVSTWALHTWLFSPMCTPPQTTPYLYITAPKGSGKTLLGQDVLGTITRQPMPTVGITGASLVRLVGGAADDPDAVDSVPIMPTLMVDEVDALYSGSKDEGLRMMLNAGYRLGGKVPRVVGKEVVNFSAFCPKILMGIDNGHLPDTVADRAIRIELQQATPEQMLTVQPFFTFDVEDESAEMCEQMAAWAIAHSRAIRQHKPEAIPGLKPRAWEIARTLVQVGHAISPDTETAIRDALADVLTRPTHAQGAKQALFSAIRDMFAEDATDRLASARIMQGLAERGIGVSGNTAKGLANAITAEGDTPPKVINVRQPDGTILKARGFYRHQFDELFTRYLESES